MSVQLATEHCLQIKCNPAIGQSMSKIHVLLKPALLESLFMFVLMNASSAQY